MKKQKRITSKYLINRRDKVGCTLSVNIRALEQQYNITQQKLVDSILEMNTDSNTGECLYTDRTLKNYIRGIYPMPAPVLMDIANFFSMLPDPEGRLHYISTDYLMGRMDDLVTMVDSDYLNKAGIKDKDEIIATLKEVHRGFFKEYENDYMKKTLGLEQEAIDTLKVFNIYDKHIISEGTKNFTGYLYHNIVPNLTMYVLNFLLKSGAPFRRLMMAFYLFSRPDAYSIPVTGHDKEYTALGDDRVCLAHNPNHLDDNIPIDIDSLSLQSIKKIEIDLILKSLAEEFAEKDKDLQN